MKIVAVPMTLTLLAIAVAGCQPTGMADKGASGEDAGTPSSSDPTAPETGIALPVAPEGSIEISAANATIQFVGSKDDGSHEGGFKEFSGWFHLPADGAESPQLAVLIETNSLWSDSDRLTGHLKNQDFFDVPNHPQALFVSTEIKPSDSDESTHEVTGDLTLLDATESVTFPIQISGEGRLATLAADFTFDRTKFGMDYGQGQVHNDVQVSVRVGGDAKTE